jgi:hypothetical protein
MKKVFLFLFCFSLSIVAVHAQEIFSKGTSVLNAGVGLGSGIPIEVSYERSILSDLIHNDNGAIGIGAYGSWYSNTASDWRYSHIVLGARGAFHYQFVEKLDTYAGLMLGYNIASAKWTGDGESIGTASASAFDFSLFLGARYFFKPKFGIYAEAGYGIAFLSAGVTLKF